MHHLVQLHDMVKEIKMKDTIKVRITEFKQEFFVDTCKFGENSWKNYAVEKTHTKALKAIDGLRECHSVLGV